MAHIGRPSPVLKNELIGMNNKFADINEADILKHVLDITTLNYPKNTVMVQLKVVRIAGTGNLLFYPMNGVNSIGTTTGAGRDHCIVFIFDGELTYAQTVANDDFDVYLMGYATQRRHRY